MVVEWYTWAQRPTKAIYRDYKISQLSPASTEAQLRNYLESKGTTVKVCELTNKNVKAADRQFNNLHVNVLKDESDVIWCRTGGHKESSFKHTAIDYNLQCRTKLPLFTVIAVSSHACLVVSSCYCQQPVRLKTNLTCAYITHCSKSEKFWRVGESNLRPL